MESETLVLVGVAAVAYYLFVYKPAPATTTNQGNTTNAGNAAGTGNNIAPVAAHINTTPAAVCVPLGPLMFSDPSQPGRIFTNPSCLG